MKCTKKIRDTTFVENGHLRKSDLSPCSAPVCTYEKVHKIRKIPFTLIYQVPKSQVNILITKKMVPIFQSAKNSPFLCRFWFFPSTGEGGAPQTPSTIINFESLGGKYVTKCSIWDFKISWDMDSGSELYSAS